MPVLEIIKKGTIKYKTSEFFFYGIIASLPFSVSVNSAFIILFILNQLLITDKKEFKNYFLYLPFLLSGLLFIFFLFSIIYSNQKDGSLFFIEKQLGLLFIPFGFLSTPFLSKNTLERSLKIFIAVCLLAAFYCFIIAFYKNYLYTSLRGLPITYIHHWNFSYHYLSSAIGMHAVYLSMYISFSLFALLLEIFGMYNLNFKIQKIWKLAIVIFFAYFLLLLASRIVIGITTVMFLLLSFYYFFQKKQLQYFFLLLVLLIAASLLIVLSNDVLWYRFQSSFISYEKAKLFSGSGDLRIKQWITIIKTVLANSPIIGVGIGDVEETYHIAYQKANLTLAIEKNYNAHNMYIEIFTSNGLIGLFIFLAILHYSFLEAIRKKNFLYFLFLIIFCTCGLTESLILRQKGLIFFILFNSIFFVYSKNFLKEKHNLKIKEVK